MGSNPTPSAHLVRNTSGPVEERVEEHRVYLDVEVTVIEIDENGDGEADDQIVIVEDVE
ncbi:MAG: hypothetical protein U0821_08235 [Chloroflexota bacterium]